MKVERAVIAEGGTERRKLESAHRTGEQWKKNLWGVWDCDITCNCICLISEESKNTDLLYRIDGSVRHGPLAALPQWLWSGLTCLNMSRMHWLPDRFVCILMMHMKRGDITIMFIYKACKSSFLQTQNCWQLMLEGFLRHYSKKNICDYNKRLQWIEQL